MAQNLTAGRADSARVFLGENPVALAAYIRHTVFKYRTAVIANLDEAFKILV